MKPECCDPIPFGAAVSITTRGHRTYLNGRLQQYNISAGQFPVLMLLAREQNIMQETLVRHYRLDKGAIARAVRKLEKAGYLRRIVDPGNRRAVRLFLTEAGERIVPVLAAIDREWEDLVCTGLSLEDRLTLTTMIRTVAGNSCRIIVGEGGCPDAGS